MLRGSIILFHVREKEYKKRGSRVRATGLAESRPPYPTMNVKRGFVMVRPHWHDKLPFIQTWPSYCAL